MNNSIEAWHFLQLDRKTRYSQRLVVPGQTLKVKGKLRPCYWGLHASVRALDALNYAPGPIICRVKCEDYLEQADKICARKRTCLWMADATKVFQKLILECIENSPFTDFDKSNALDLHRKYFRGEITLSQLYNESKYPFDIYYSTSIYGVSAARVALALSKTTITYDKLNLHLEDLLFTLRP